MRRLRLLVSAAVLGGLLVLPAVSAAQDDNTLIELLKTDVQAEKKGIIAGAMTLTDAQGAAFWPIYNKYATELSLVYDQRVAIMKDYAAKVDSLTDKDASDLVKRTLKAEGDVTKLKDKYFKEFSKAVGPKIAGQFLQYESTLLRLIDLKLGLIGLTIPELKKQ